MNNRNKEKQVSHAAIEEKIEGGRDVWKNQSKYLSHLIKPSNISR